MTRQAWKAVDALLTRLRPHRAWLSLLIDGSIIWVAWQATHLFRMGFDRWLSARAPYDPIVALCVVAAYLIIFRAMRLPAHLWRFTAFVDIQRLAIACLAAGVLCGVLISPVLQLAKVPRAVLALHPFFSLMGVCLARLLVRMFVDHLQARLHGPREPLRPALVLGAGEAAKRLMAGIQGQGWQVLGLLDDDPLKAGAWVAGVRVWGAIDQVQEVAERVGASHLILAMPSVRGAARHRAIELASATRLPLLTVPSAQELQEGQKPSRLRDIEPDDLLGREPIELDDAVVAGQVRGRAVLVTGAGGSIGSELCLQLAAFEPSLLVLVDHAEYPIYRVQQQLLQRHARLRVVACLVDVKDPVALEQVMVLHRPSLVLHAAAYKHVPLVEVGNAWAALCNNALGTWATARSAARAGVERFVLVSTDKAVNPTNVMGATKRAAERLMVALAAHHPQTRFMAVRFGNVLGSSGSVIPLFKEQIARGGPVTVTHPDIIRYFMTIPEACRLVLQAAARGGTGQVLVLDMGQPVKIVDLAKAMIRLSGHREDEIPIIYTGLRPGEKLYEELLADEETTERTTVPQLRLARLNPDVDLERAQRWVDEASALPGSMGEPAADAARLEEAVRRHLRQLVPEFQDQAAQAPRLSPAAPVEQTTA